jgi:hypothetical protein
MGDDSTPKDELWSPDGCETILASSSQTVNLRNTNGSPVLNYCCTI